MGVEALEEMATKEMLHGARTLTRSSQAGHTGVGKSIEALAHGWPETNTNARYVVFEVDRWGEKGRPRDVVLRVVGALRG